MVQRSPLPKLLRILMAASVLTAGACSHKVESPAVGISKLEPDLVCNAQRITPSASIKVLGDGFTPMPVQALETPVQLVLPSITLSPGAEIVPGAGAPQTKIVYPGDPRGTNPLIKSLSWQSENQMTFAVSVEPSVNLDPGLYDVTVTNPDKEHEATRKAGLAVVPPPSVAGITVTDVAVEKDEPPVVCTAEKERKLHVEGKNFLKVGASLPTVEITVEGGTTPETPTVTAATGCVAVTGTYLGGTIELCTGLDMTLAQGLKNDCDHAGTKYCLWTVKVRSPAGVPDTADCASSENIDFVTVPPPFIDSVQPPAICLDQGDQTVTVSGGQFIQFMRTPQDSTDLPEVHIQGTDASGTAVDQTFTPTLDPASCSKLTGLSPPGDTPETQLCTSLTITVKQGQLPVGKYSLTVTNPDPAGGTAEKTEAVTVSAPPRVDAVIPQSVCSGGGVLAITGEGFEQGATVELRCPTGAAPPTTVIKSASATVSADGKTINATFGTGMAVGDVCDVVVINPSGCEDRPLPHKTVTGTEGPILFYVDPFVVFNGINTKVILYVTAITGTPTVKIVPPAACTGATEVTLQATLVSGKTNRLQATVPKDTPACDSYDVVVSDDTGCAAVLPGGLEVVSQTSLVLNSIVPPFGASAELVPVEITGDGTSGGGFKPTPRGFLNPNPAGPTDVAVQLEGVSYIDAAKLTAVVPAGTPVGKYDLIVINPAGEVGVLQNAYTSLATAPPVISDITPGSILTQTGQQVTLSGSGFNGPTVTLDCKNAAGATVAAPTVSNTNCTATSCTVTLDASATPNGAICVFKVTNPDGTYAQFSALGVTNPSYNLQAPVAATSLNTARRALYSAAVRANSVSRYVYAIGGDGGQASAASPFNSVEFASVDLYGKMSAWTNNKETLGAARSFLGGSSVGRYIYALGGSSGSGSLASAERAIVLSPSEIPHLEDVDLCLSGGKTPCFGMSGLGAGLDAGVYSYRVAAVIDATDPVNLGGETLASDPLLIKLPLITGKKISVKLVWSPPKDSLGVDLSGITGYRIYRTPKDGVSGQEEVLLDSVTGSTTLSYIDDGTKTLGTDKPLPAGSTSAWRALPAMTAPRRALAGAAAQDRADATKWYVYALEGEGLASYEYLTVTVAPNGRQTVGAAWTAGSQPTSVARHEFGAWVVTPITSPISASDTWIFLGGGRSTAGQTNLVEAHKLPAGGGGDLGAPIATNNFNQVRAGYAPFVVGNKLFLFGGAQLPAGTPQNNAIGAIMQPPMPALANWNNEGISMTTARYLHGSSIQSAFVFLIGGDAGAGGPALATTETVAW